MQILFKLVILANFNQLIINNKIRLRNYTSLK